MRCIAKLRLGLICEGRFRGRMVPDCFIAGSMFRKGKSEGSLGSMPSGGSRCFGDYFGDFKLGEIMHKWIFLILVNFFFAFFLSLTLGIFLPLCNGGPVTVDGIVLALLWGTPVATIFSTICPLMKWGEKWACSLGVKPGSSGVVFVRDIFLATIMFAVMGLVLTGVMTGWDPSTYVARWLGVIPTTWGPAYVVSLIVEPLCFWLAAKLSGGVPAEFAKQSAEVPAGQTA